MDSKQLPVPSVKTSNLSTHVTLFITIVIWASTFINIKIVLPQVPPNTLAFLRFLIASVVLLGFSYNKKQKIARDDWKNIALCGLTGITLYNFFQNQGLKYAGATDAAILASMAPVFMAILGRLILKEKLTKRQIAGITIAFTGSVLVATNGSFKDMAFDKTRLWGDFLILLTGLAWGFYNISLKKLLNRYSPTVVLTYSTIAATIFLLPLMLIERPNFSSINLVGWTNIIYLGLLASALAYLLWNKALLKVSTVTAGAYLYLIPVIAAVIAALFLKEIPTVYTVIGGIMAMIGTYFAGDK